MVFFSEEAIKVLFEFHSYYFFVDCFPGSYAFNGSCIYFSSRKQRLSWSQAKDFCQRLPLNTSFLVIENYEEYEFIRKTIIRLKVKEEPVDQLVFLVGFSNTKGNDRFLYFAFFNIFINKAVFFTLNKAKMAILYFF